MKHYLFVVASTREPGHVGNTEWLARQAAAALPADARQTWVRLAEAFAECLHQRVRTDLWGYAADEQLGNEELIAEKYRGIRPAPGYPACPDHTVKRAMFALLQADEIGMGLTESLAMTPAASVSGFYLAHPESTYFNVGPISQDQLDDLAQRRGQAAQEWLPSSGIGGLVTG